MGRHCNRCGRYFEIGAWKYTFCKECRHKPTHVIFHNQQPAASTSTTFIQGSYPMPGWIGPPMPTGPASLPPPPPPLDPNFMQPPNVLPMPIPPGFDVGPMMPPPGFPLNPAFGIPPPMTGPAFPPGPPFLDPMMPGMPPMPPGPPPGPQFMQATTVQQHRFV